jgi:uncharacterized phage-like protein YoqJ
MILAGTGHRPEKLGGYRQLAFIEQRLLDLCRAALERYQPHQVISGMALGFDIALAEAALELRLPLIAAVAFEGVERVWSPAAQARFRRVLAEATEVVIVSERPADRRSVREAMNARNRYMVDRCDALMSLWSGAGGGTADCVRYADGRVPIIALWTHWVRHRDAGKER